MKNKKEIKIDESVLQLEDILQATPSEEEPQQGFMGTIQMGNKDEIIKKILLEANKE